MSTANLLLLKISVNLTGLLVAALVQLLATLLFGPLFIDNFYQIVAEYWNTLVTEWSYSIVEGAVLGILLVAIFASLVSIYATAITWLFVSSRKLIWVLAAIPFYGLLIFLLLVAFNQPVELQAAVVKIAGLHLWLVLAGAIGITVYFFQVLLRDRVLNPTQFFTVLIATGILWLLHASYVQQESLLAPTRSLVFAVANTLQGLLPLFAIAFMLWTLHRTRHS